MIKVLSDEEMASIPVLDLSAILDKPAGSDGSCLHCEAFRPEPQRSGNLQVDPEIHLPSPGFDVDLAYYYNASSSNNGPFGYGRTLSPYLTAQASGSPTLVTLTRDNGAQVSYSLSGSSYVAQTPGLLNSLVKDTTNSYWKETTPDGMLTAYPLDTAGHLTTVSYIQDAVGNTHTMSYSSGLLQTLEDAVGRVVSFSYSGGLLQTIEDWAGRLTTFQYNTTLASPDNLLTTVTGPTGCQTQYQYSTFTQFSGGTYSGKWFLSGIVDPNGYGTSYSFDMQGRIINRVIQGAGTYTYLYQPNLMWIVDPLGNITTQTTGSSFSLTNLQDALGAITSYTRNANLQETSRQNPLGAVWTTSYDGNGNVVGRIDPLGNQTTLTRDSFNNITSMQTADGAIWTNVWGYAGSSFDTTGAKRRLQAQINPLGNITSTTFNGRGQVLSVQNPLGYLTTLGYDGFGNPISKQDALGYLWTSVFDLAGNVVGQTNPLGNTWSTSYDNQNRPLTQVDPLGNTSTMAYDSVGNRTVSINPLGYRTSWSYNVFDMPVAKTDALGYLWTSVFDSLGRQVASVDPLGNASTAVFDATGRPVGQMNSLGAVWTSVFDVAGRQVASQIPLGYLNTTVFDIANRPVASVDALGNRSTQILDSLGRVIATQDPLGYLSSTVYDLAGRKIASENALGYRNTTVYDAASEAIAAIDPLGRTDTSVFDQMGRVVVSVDGLGYRSSTVFDQAGRAVAGQDANGNVSTVIFDEANRAIAALNALGYLWTTVFDAASRAISFTDPLARISSNVYDALNRKIAIVSPLGYCSTTNFDSARHNVSSQDANGVLWSTVFDGAGRRIASLTPLGYRFSTVYNAANWQIATQDALGYLSTTLFDSAGHVVGQVNPLGFVWTTLFDADSRRIAQVDPLANRTSTIFDAAGRRIAVQDARGYQTSFILDAANQQIAVLDANRGRTSSLFDGRGIQYASQDPLGAFTSFQFDPVGNTILRTDARNWPTTYLIDALNRTIGQIYIDSTRVTNTFDAAGQQITSQDVTDITTYTWDLDSRKIVVLNPTGIALTSTLDPVGNRLVLQDIGGRTSYSWDTQNRLTGIVNPYAEATTIQWDALNREQYRILANGMSVSHTFDAIGRETLIGNRNAAGFGLAVFTNTYDSVGNRLTVLELDGTHVTFGYDASYQLINEQRSGTYAYNTTYLYDGLGNRLQKIDSGLVTTGTFNAANEIVLLQPPSEAPTTSSWDANGNLVVENTGGTLTSYSWDPENRLLGVAGSTNETYQYSQDGLRKSKTNSSGTTVFTWDQQNVLLEANEGLVIQARYTDYPGYWGGLASERQGANSSFYGFDSQSSSRILVSTGGVVTDNYSYKAFGEELQAGSGTTNPARYVGLYGYYHDAISRQYVRARVLDNTIGKWMSKDPIGFDGSEWNLYAYVTNNPNMGVDPAGLVPITCSSGTGLPSGIGRSDKNYPCIASVCAQYKALFDDIWNFENSWCSNAVICKLSVICLRDERLQPGYHPIPNNPHGDTPPCDTNMQDDQGGGSGRYAKKWSIPGELIPAFACCQECHARMCWWSTNPNIVSLEYWVRHAIRQCATSNKPPIVPPTLPGLPDGFVDCLNSPVTQQLLLWL